MLGIKPGAAGWVASMLPLCYATAQAAITLKDDPLEMANRASLDLSKIKS